MSLTYQLRIVDSNERLKIHDLDESKGITTVGQDLPSDIVLESPATTPFRLALDYRQEPCRLSVSDQSKSVTVNEEAVPAGSGRDIYDQDEIRVAGYTITFRAYAEEPSGTGAAPAPPKQPEPGSQTPPEAPPVPATPDWPTAPPPETETAPASERAEPAILASVSEQAVTIDVEQAISFQLTVVNAGDLVAQFNVTAKGGAQEWATITPAEFHLNERERTTVEVTVAPPRLPTSRAGTHSLTLVVTSPHYPHERAQTRTAITIKPYYELAVGNLSPRRQSIPWSQPSGQTEVPLTNKGNSEVLVGLTGEDDALACRFEFEVPDEIEEAVSLTKRVDVRIPFNKTVKVLVRLIPRSRPLIGRGGRLIDVRPRVYPYTVTVAMAQGQQGPLTLAGEWENSPRFSQRVLLVSTLGLILLLLAFTCAIFDPRITSRNFAKPDSIRAGQVVKLDWTAWPPFLISFKLDGKPVAPPVYDRPEQTTTYELRAETWLSHFWPGLAATALDTVEVRPVKPDILLFEAVPKRTTPGQKVVLSWVVDDARELVLIDHGAGLQETLASPCGSREIQVGEESARYTLRATAAGGAVAEGAVTVQVASPVIALFSVVPPAITATTDITLTWWVLGASDGITLSRSSFDVPSGEFVDTFTSSLPSRGETTQTVASTTVFSLSVASGAAQLVETARVKVPRPTPIPAPTPAPTRPPTPTRGPAPAPGTVVVYTALSPEELEPLGAVSSASLAKRMPDSFRGTDLTLTDLKEFGYVLVVTPTNEVPINILLVRESTQDLIRRLLAEKENPRADVIWMVAATGMIRLRAEGLLEPLAGLYKPQGLEKIKDGWRDPALPPHWLGLTAWRAAFCVNRNRLQARGLEPPESWEDLTEPQYHGLIAMPNPYSSGTGYMVVAGLMQKDPFGEPMGWATMDRLHENVAWYTASGIEPCQLAADNGNPQIAIGIGANLCSSDNDPGKLAIVYPEEGSGWEMDAVALVRKDKVSNDALAFVAWAISQDAMQGYAQFRPGFSYSGFEPQRTCFGAPGEDGVSPSWFLWASANYERLTEKWLSRYAGEPDLIQLQPVH